MEENFEEMYNKKFERLYEKMLAEGKEKISEDLAGEVFFTLGTRGHAYACRVQKLEDELRTELLSTENKTLSLA